MAESAEVNEGASSTVSEKDSSAATPTPLIAWRVNVWMPPVPTAGVPAKVAVPSPLSVRVTPAGKSPFSEIAAVGKPVVVTAKVPWLPTVKVVPAPDVMAAGWSTVSVKDCVAVPLA